MKRILLIDGENLKGKIKDIFKENNKDEPIWHLFDFNKLFENVLKDKDVENKVFYFAKIKQHPDSIDKSKELIESQRLLKTHLEKNGFEVIMSGSVRGNYKENKKGHKILTFKEKGVDVKIAVDIVSMACDKKVDEIFLASSDSDMQPAIKEGRDRGVKFTYIGFETRQNKGLMFTTQRTVLIRDTQVFESYNVSSKK
jgi:uncharacterized LabA/DUF88 family protein